MRAITFSSSSGATNIDNACRVHVDMPSIGRVNPSDCVDMDCNGMKMVLLKDLDGSFTATGLLHTTIPKAEFGKAGTLAT